MVYSVEGVMVSAQVQALATMSERGREMVVGLPAFREEGMATVFVRIISCLCTPLAFPCSCKPHSPFSPSGGWHPQAYKGFLAT